MSSHSWIQNGVDPQRNERIGKVFELVELRFRRNIKRNFHIKVIFPDCNRNRILNPHCPSDLSSKADHKDYIVRNRYTLVNIQHISLYFL